MKYLSFIFLLAIVACNSNEDPKPLEVEDLQEPSQNGTPPANSIATTMGTFTSYAHSLSGKAVIYTDQNTTRTLRLEEFTMTPGPDVYVLLSKTNNYSSANTIPIAMLKDGYTNTNLSMTLDNSIDLTTHKFVLVYCVKFSSLFGFAEPK
jgi:hypothetical protein